MHSNRVGPEGEALAVVNGQSQYQTSAAAIVTAISSRWCCSETAPAPKAPAMTSSTGHCCHHTAAGGRFRILGVMRGDEIVGGVALYERPSRGGAYVSPRLLLYYNGVVVRRYETQYPSEATARQVKIRGALETALSGIGLGSINLRSRGLHDVRPFVAKGWTVAASYSYVVPLDLTAAYSAFPNGGYAVRPRGIARVIDADGSVAFDNPVSEERVISEQVAFQMVSMLEDVVDRGTGASARTTYGIRFPVAGKTGTTDEFKDAWFVGFTSNVVVGVWVGQDQPASIGREAYGARYALPIWSDIMKSWVDRRSAELSEPPTFARPGNVVLVDGEAYIAGTEPGIK